MKKIIITLSVLLAICLNVHGQINLVLNGSFEQYDTCPSNYDQIRYANYWNGIDTVYSYALTTTAAKGNFLPDYMNVCNSGGICRVPNNPNFYHYPRTGNGLMQNIMYFDYAYAGGSGLNEYNYSQGKLVTNLIAGQLYCVTFYVCQAHGSGYSINKIGAYLDNGTIDTTQTPALPQSQYTPQVLETAVISDTLNWTKIQGSFTANGTEKFITIGVFFDTMNVTHFLNNFMMGGLHYGLYLIDDVSVIASDAKAYAGRDTTIMPGDTVKLGPALNGDGMPCYWYKYGVAAPIDSGGNSFVHPDSTTRYVVKMKLCGVVTYDTVKVTVWPLSILNGQLSMDNVRVYPNPVVNELTIEGARGCEMHIFDVVGREIRSIAFPSPLERARDRFDVSELMKGVYFVKITDPLTGESVTKRLLKE